MHVALPVKNILCASTAVSGCFLLSQARGSWQLRQLAELLARISSQTMLARRQRSFELRPGGDRSAQFCVTIGDTAPGLVEQLGRIRVRDMAVDAHRPHADRVGVMERQLVFGVHELRVRMTRRATGLVSFGDGERELGADHRSGTDDEAGQQQRYDRPARRRQGQGRAGAGAGVRDGRYRP